MSRLYEIQSYVSKINESNVLRCNEYCCNNALRPRSCLPPFCGEAEAVLRRCTILSSPPPARFFADRFVALIIVITGGRPVRTRAFSPSLIPVHPPFASPPPPSAIDFGQANYIFSPAVERIKL